MQRDDWMWLAIRVFGIYLLILTAAQIPYVLSSVAGIGLLWSHPIASGSDDAKDAFNDMERGIAQGHVTTFINSIISCVVYGIGSLHLLRGGKLVLRLMQPNQPAPTSATTDTVREDSAC